MAIVDDNIDILELEGKQYKRAITKEGEYWDLKTIAKHTEVPYRTISYHLKDKKQLFEPFIKKMQIVAFNQKKPSVFLKIPEGLNNLRICVRALRFHPIMDRILELASELQKGKLKVAHKDDIEKFKEAQQKTHHLILGQDLTFILKRLDRIENLIIQQNGAKALPDASTQDSKLMDLDRKKIIAWLFDHMVEEHGVPFYEIWWIFCEEVGIANNSYAKQHKNLFPKMINFFFTRDVKLVVRVYNWYNSQPKPDEDIKDILLTLFEKTKQKKLINFDDPDVIT